MKLPCGQLHRIQNGISTSTLSRRSENQISLQYIMKYQRFTMKIPPQLVNGEGPIRDEQETLQNP